VKRENFIHLVRLSEQANADDNHAYRRGIAAFAALGYIWVVGCFALSVAILIWTAVSMGQGLGRTYHFVLLIAGCGLLWGSLRAFWSRLGPPAGLPITELDAPRLFAALERIRAKIKAPRIHHVLLDSSFNASISQIPRFGLLGGSINYLTIGLPLLMVVDRSRFFVVVAHEYGHLRNGPWQLTAWIYRTRQSWTKLDHSMRLDNRPLAIATQAFLRWYFPRFLAKSFALARHDEFAADRIAAKLLGRETAGAALTEIAIKGHWLDSEFWPLHWSAAAINTQPIGPFSAMNTLLAQPMDDNFARMSLRHALIQLSDEEDTHPALRERLEALKARKHMPQWSKHLALNLLGKDSAKWLAHFDKLWCSENATGWKLHHAYLSRVQVGIDTLTASLKRNNADEMTQLGDLHRRLNNNASVRVHFERALQITPGHASALLGLAQCMPESEHAARLDCLNQLYELNPANRSWTCSTAVSMLEKQVALGLLDEKALKVWRARLKQARDSEEHAWMELSRSPFFESITRHDLNDFEESEFRSTMARCKPVARAWLVRRSPKEFSYLRSYVLFVELPDMHDDDCHALCQRLKRMLRLSGLVLVTWAGQSASLTDIQRHAFDAVYIRQLD
jgi:hypothetical protein